ncbi:MAG: hypothetical protein KDB27_09610 [Planctomycetales bacterium]|nr:hypothetical protein [Planctomycetales bacterium]
MNATEAEVQDGQPTNGQAANEALAWQRDIIEFLQTIHGDGPFEIRVFKNSRTTDGGYFESSSELGVVVCGTLVARFDAATRRLDD